VGSNAGPSALRAAGGVVHRGADRDLEIALVYRPRYRDWSLPKGKLHDGETPLHAATREVGEEIGASVAVTRRLNRVQYDFAGLPKIVDYWAMRALEVSFEPNHEVSEVKWLPPADARKQLSYDHDREIIDTFTAVPVVESVVTLVRHARAGKRAQWRGPDSARPLDRTGREQAAALAAFLALFRPIRVIAADRVRCIQTLEPLAEQLELRVERDPLFNDESYERDPGATHGRLLELASALPASSVCSQGYTIPELVRELGLAPSGRATNTRKAATWVIGFAGGVAICADYYRTPAEPR
jgi:8-oxo-dGTP pyrophosphatase MutT (NUDIX family)